MPTIEVAIDLVDANPFLIRSPESLSDRNVRLLADEIEELGYWQTALRAREVAGRYQIAWGHRRLLALKSLGQQTLQLDVQELSDDRMCIEHAAENFQQNTLTEQERLAAFKLVNRAPRGPEEVMQILGIKLDTYNRFAKLCVYEEATQAVREAIQNGETTARTVAAADSFGGEEMVATCLDQGMTSRDIEKLRREVNLLRDSHGETTADQVKAEILSGKLGTPDELRERADGIRKEHYEHAVQSDSAPPDIVQTVRAWINNLPDVTQRLSDVAPHLDFVQEQDSVLAAQLERYLDELEKTLEKLRTLMRTSATG